MSHITSRSLLALLLCLRVSESQCLRVLESWSPGVWVLVLLLCLTVSVSESQCLSISVSESLFQCLSLCVSVSQSLRA